MGQTKDAIKKEIENVFKDVYNGLTEHEQLLTKEEKVRLREFLQELSSAKIHAFSNILIQRKIKNFIAQRENKPHETSKIETDVETIFVD